MILQHTLLLVGTNFSEFSDDIKIAKNSTHQIVGLRNFKEMLKLVLANSNIIFVKLLI